MKLLKTVALFVIAIVVMAWLILFSKGHGVGFLKPVLAVLVSGILCSYALLSGRESKKIEPLKFIMTGIGFCAVALLAVFIFMSGFAR